MPTGNIIEQHYNTFTHNQAVYEFQVFILQEDPTSEIGAVGDICKNGEVFYVRYRNEWRKAETGRDSKNRPLQGHPTLKLSRRLDFESSLWRSYTYWNSRKNAASGEEQGGSSQSPLQSKRACDTSMEVTSKKPRIECGEHAVPSPENPISFSNSWLLDVLKLWTSFPNTGKPNYKTGIDIINALIQYPRDVRIPPIDHGSYGVPILGEPRFEGGIRPSLAMVFRDLMKADSTGASCNVVDFVAGLSEPEARAEDILQSWTYALSADKWAPHMRLFGALDIPFHPSGMGRCGIIASPYESDPTTSFNKKVKWVKSWSTGIVPPGSITHTHSDGFGCSQYMVHLMGKKLWLFWPPTQLNMEFYRLHVFKRVETLTLESIGKLEGLQVHYMDETMSAFVVPPNYLHAVLTIAGSTHCGITFYALSDFPEAVRIMKWFLNFAKDFSSTGNTARDACDITEKLLEEGVSWFEEIIRVNKADPRTRKMKVEIEDIKTEANELLTTLKSL